MHHLITTIWVGLIVSHISFIMWESWLYTSVATIFTNLLVLKLIPVKRLIEKDVFNECILQKSYQIVILLLVSTMHIVTINLGILTLVIAIGLTYIGLLCIAAVKSPEPK